MKIGIIGASGRMGQEIIKVILDETFGKPFQLIGASVKKNHPLEGKEIVNYQTRTSLNIKYSSDVNTIFKEADAVIDFTQPSYSLEIALLASKYKTIHVCGTTGFNPQELLALHQLANQTVIFWSPNMSVGIHVLKNLVQQASVLLDETFDSEVLEMHHRNKIDAPSGTALMLGQEIANSRKLDFDQEKVLTRCKENIIRKPKNIGFASLRGGGVVGEHTVIFASDDEKIELKHTMYDRGNYAKCSLKIAQWLKSQKPSKLYTMQDYLE